MADVFISYKKEDRALAERVEAALTAAGLTSWWDASLHPRESWDAIIEREIEDAAAVVVIWTARSVQSEWVRIEANFGKEHRKLVPLILEDCRIPLAFSMTQAASLSNWNGAPDHGEWRKALDWISVLVSSGDRGTASASSWGRAAEAARSGRSIAERTFPLELPGVPNWPNPELVAIPPGRFLMGSIPDEFYRDEEYPQHEVVIDYAFGIGRNTVTFAEYDTYCRDTGRQKPDDNGWGRLNRPVINVSWEDTQSYIDWLNDRLGIKSELAKWRLPSEAEWEYACRAGTTTPFNTGETITPIQANFCGTAGDGGGPMGQHPDRTQPVGSYTANGFGLYDMHGNVWEWCFDAYHEDYAGAPTNGAVWAHENPLGRIIRGGSWMNDTEGLRSAARLENDAPTRDANIGFRIARTLDPA